jgi:tetratricopeptide (TPR) repeat protein
MSRLLQRNAVLIVLLLAGSPAGAAESPSLAAGKKALEGGDAAAALPLFETAQREAVAAQRLDEQADAAFYVGLTLQRQAERASGAEADALRRRAVDSYRRSLEWRPGSVSAANNLALALTALNETDAALGVLQAAGAGASEPAYLSMNRGELLARKGDLKAATAAYEAALRAEPHNEAAEAALFELRRARDPAGLPAHLWALVDAKRVTLAVSRALVLLRAGPDGGVPAEHRPEILAVVAAACSRQVYDPARWLGGSTATALRALRDDPTIGRGAAELLQLHESDPPTNSVMYAWWALRPGLGREPARGVAPLTAFQSLARALARWHREAGQPQKAEALYLLSTHLNRQEPDPTALLELADMLAANGKLAQLEALMEKEEPDIFYGKGQAYGSAQTAAIYDYHRALGVIYSYTGKLSGGPASAEFQLQRAIEVAGDYNRQPRGAPIQVEPRLYDLLATTYEKTGRQDRAGAVRIAAVEDALSRKDVVAAAQLATPLRLPASPLRAADRERWTKIDRLLGMAAWTEASRPTGLGRVSAQDVALKGIVKNGADYVALVETGGGTFFVRAGDRLVDGSIRAIDAQGVTVRRKPVGDPKLVEERLVLEATPKPR